MILYQSREAESLELANLRAPRSWASRTLASWPAVSGGSGIGAINMGVSGNVTLSFGATSIVLAQPFNISRDKQAGAMLSVSLNNLSVGADLGCVGCVRLFEGFDSSLSICIGFSSDSGITLSRLLVSPLLGFGIFSIFCGPAKMVAIQITYGQTSQPYQDTDTNARTEHNP